MLDRANLLTKAFYNDAYSIEGFEAQRRYPNEELCRFMGRNYFHVSRSERHLIRILEVGCGSGANLWMIAREGFDAYGIDLSEEAIHLCRQMLLSYGVSATLSAVDMTETKLPNVFFDAVIDVFSSNCLNEESHQRFLEEVRRVLKPGGRYFCYTPSKASDAFINHTPAKKIDGSTLDGVKRKSSPYCGNLYPFRFSSSKELGEMLAKQGLVVDYNETVGRTYRNGEEYFEFVVVSATRVS